MTSFTLKNKHIILNCGDMKKDAREEPNISSYSIFNSSRKIITGGIDCASLDPSFLELKKLINNELLDKVKRYCYGTLLPIPEAGDEKYENITFLNKMNRQIVPVNVTNAFIDAAMDPRKYFVAEKAKINVCETPGSIIDPASRLDSTIFYPNEDSRYSLDSYGFKEGSTINYIHSKNVGDYKYINIILDSNNSFEGLLDRKGNVDDNYQIKLNGTLYNNSNSGAYREAIKNIFRGNHKKNSYIKNNANTTNMETKMLCVLLIFFKELGDTSQPIIINELFKKVSSLKEDNSCLLTIDTILACRSSLINVPYLLNSNSIITYYAAISKEVYETNMKITEITKTIQNNKIIINEFENLLKKIESDSDNLIIQGTTYKINSIVKNKFGEIINCINKANEFLNILKEQITNKIPVLTKIISIILRKENYREITDEPFYKFRTIVQSLQAQSIYIYKSKKKRMIHGKYCVFPQKLIIKDNYYSWADCINNILFENGVLNFIIKSSYQSRNTLSRRGGTKESMEVDEDDDDISKDDYNVLYCYSLLYPYIYCNPYLIQYILKSENDELNNILTDILSNDTISRNNFIVPKNISQTDIDNLYSEELFNSLQQDDSFDSNIDIDNYHKYTNQLLKKITDFVKNMPDTSLLEKDIYQPENISIKIPEFQEKDIDQSGIQTPKRKISQTLSTTAISPSKKQYKIEVMTPTYKKVPMASTTYRKSNENIIMQAGKKSKNKKKYNKKSKKYRNKNNLRKTNKRKTNKRNNTKKKRKLINK